MISPDEHQVALQVFLEVILNTREPMLIKRPVSQAPIIISVAEKKSGV